MKLRHFATLALVAFALVGCKKKQPPAAGPTAPVAADTATPVDTAAERLAREEALRLAERAAAERARVRNALSEIIFFDYDSFELTSESEEKLRAKAAVLREYPGVRIRVEGHADQRGSTEYNMVLGQKRAQAVRDFLAAYGISAERVSTLSYGKERPLAEGEGESAWARNRRAEFAVLGGLP